MPADFHKQPTQPTPPEDTGVEIPETIPAEIGPYKIESLFDKGGMSILYLGIHPETHVVTTIKVLSPKFLSNPDVVQRFLNEAEIIAMADHPNIIKLFGYGHWEGGLYISMEFIEGVSLRQYLLHHPISLKRALEIVIDIAYALCHLHTHGVIHRDLKPENVLITSDGDVKVIDFGIAQLLTERENPETTGKQRLMGTPIYMSPEQRENPESVSYPSDIYSLGIVMYELILGKLSHGQIHISLMPKGIQKILLKTLQPDPNNRYQDIVDFIYDVSNYLNSDLLLKEKKTVDQISEISENLKKMQTFLISETPPQWPQLKIGVAISKTPGVSGVYQDFFQAAEGYYGLMMGETSAKDAEGFLYSAMLRGMVRGLCRLTNHPRDMALIINDNLLKEHIPHIFSMTYAIFNAEHHKAFFIACGRSHAWMLKKNHQASPLNLNNIALGIDPQADFKDLQFSWEPGDRLVLCIFAGDDVQMKEALVKQTKSLIEETAHDSPQKQSNTILRKLKHLTKSNECTLSIVSIEHNG